MGDDLEAVTELGMQAHTQPFPRTLACARTGPARVSWLAELEGGPPGYWASRRLARQEGHRRGDQPDSGGSTCATIST